LRAKISLPEKHTARSVMDLVPREKYGHLINMLNNYARNGVRGGVEKKYIAVHKIRDLGGIF